MLTRLDIEYEKSFVDVALVQVRADPFVTPETLKSGRLSFSDEHSHRLLRVLRGLSEFDIVVFPEYSVPPSLLPDFVAAMRADQIVVAGSHYVDHASTAYKALTTSPPMAPDGRCMNVCPVLYGNSGAVCYVQKQMAGDFEYRSMHPGSGGRVFELNFQLQRSCRFSVQVCKDFMTFEDKARLEQYSSQLFLVTAWNPDPGAFEMIARDLVENHSKCVGIANIAFPDRPGFGHSQVWGFIHKNQLRDGETSLLRDAEDAEAVLTFEYNPEARIHYPGTAITYGPPIDPDHTKVTPLSRIAP